MARNPIYWPIFGNILAPLKSPGPFQVYDGGESQRISLVPRDHVLFERVPKAGLRALGRASASLQNRVRQPRENPRQSAF